MTIICDVIIPCYKSNHELLINAIQSVLQDRRSDQFLITLVIDCDQCDYTFVTDRFPQINIIYNETNLGTRISAQRAIDHTTAPFFIMVDHDDEITKDAISDMIMLADGYDVVKPKIDIQHRVRFYRKGRYYHYIHDCGVLYRRSTLLDHNIRYRRDVKIFDNFPLWLQYNLYGRVRYVDFVSYKWNYVEDSVSTKIWSSVELCDMLETLVDEVNEIFDDCNVHTSRASLIEAVTIFYLYSLIIESQLTNDDRMCKMFARYIVRHKRAFNNLRMNTFKRLYNDIVMPFNLDASIVEMMRFYKRGLTL